MVDITQYRNAIARNADNTMIDVEILHPDFDWMPYTINPADTDQTIDNEALMNMIGSDFQPYVAPTQAEIDEAASDFARQQRNDLLTEVDMVASNPLRWSSMTKQEQGRWAKYRQELLDITNEEGFPHDIKWPTKPE